jgi:hypothetical protein
MADIFPTRASQFALWYNRFSTEASEFQSVMPNILTNAVLTQLTDNNTAIQEIHQYIFGINTHVAGMAASKRRLLDGDYNLPLGQISVAPPPPAIPAGAIAGVKPWTRRLIRQIKSHPAYGPSIGAALGIVMTPSEREEPSLIVRSVIDSVVTLRVRRGGFSAVAIEGKRGDGDWETVGFATISRFQDARPPLEEGRAEWREDRAQGIHRNERTGMMSPIVGTWTAPSG